MTRRSEGTRARHRASLLLLGLAGLLLQGCLGKPKLEDRWTRIDVMTSNIASGQMLTQGTTVPVTMHSRLIYRKILTGFAVAELRASATLTAGDVSVFPNAPRLAMARDIDRILQNSVTAGRATRAFTGWDHLMQDITFNFDAVVPTSADSTGAPPTGLFLICYLGSGVEVELPSGADSVIVTPFNPDAYELLPVGMELGVAGPGSR